MMGAVLGLLGAALVVKGLVRAARYRRGWYGQGAYSGHGCHGHGGWHRHRHFGRGPFGRGFDRSDRDWGDDVDEGYGGGYGGPMILRGVFERLRTTPGQERAIVEALKELKGAFRKAGGDAKKAAGDIGDAMRSEEFSTEAMGNAFANLDGATETIRTAAFAALAKIHEALDSTQRKVLADFLKRPRGLEDLASSV